MALNLDELIRHAKDYVQLEANAAVLSAVHHETLTLFGREDVVLSVTIDDPSDPEWWVIGGSTPMNLYTKMKFPSADEAFSFHRGLMLRMLDRQASRSDGPPESIGYDAFICHASEDKELLVRPLAEDLVERGFDIWYDEFELTVGDSLRQSIDRGLASSRFGIVILSPAFLDKNWPQYELNGLTAREIEGGESDPPGLAWHYQE